MKRRSFPRIGLVAAAAFLAAPLAAAETSVEGKLEPFLGTSRMEMRQVFKGNRFPNVVVATDGTVLVFWNGVKVRRSEDGGKTWGDEILVGKGFMGGGVTVDETSGDILAFVEKSHPPAPLTVYRSTDHGKTWKIQETVIQPDSSGNVPSMHMNEHGITLRHGKHKGRLLRPSRWYAGKNEKARWPKHYTNAIYSDDGGRTWKTSEPFPAMGTGEATLVELSDGRIYYNSRRHWAPKGQNPRRRWIARSDDGGQTWKGLSICEILPDGDQVRDYGLMAGLVRLAVAGRDVLVFSNIESQSGRHHGTVWASFDGGKTWPIKRLVFEGKFAYSSLDAGRPGTASEGWVYLLFEGGPKGGGTVARFNLTWLLAGEKTGDGALPEWLDAGARGPAGPPGREGWKLVWSDEFDKPGLPDKDKWNYEKGWIRNNELQYYTRARKENARVADGMLIIEARKEKYANPDYDPDAKKPSKKSRQFAEYTSASLVTRGKASWRYGRIEVRAKLPTGRGMWPAIWMLGENLGKVGWPTCGEIDIMENVGFDPDVIHGSVHTKKYNHVKRTQKSAKIKVAKPYKDFHVYAIEWSPKQIDFFVDKKKYLTFKNEGSGEAAWPFDQPHYLILNIAVGGGWGGQRGVDKSIFPQRFHIDYVRIYQRPSDTKDASQAGSREETPVRSPSLLSVLHISPYSPEGSGRRSDMIK